MAVRRSGSAGLYGDELVLRVAGRDEDESAHRPVAGVANGVGHPPRNEDEGTRGDWDLAVSELERGVAVRDVERLVRVWVEVQPYLVPPPSIISPYSASRSRPAWRCAWSLYQRSTIAFWMRPA